MIALHVALCAGLELVYALVVFLVRSGHYPYIPPAVYPQLPPLAITIFLFLDPTGILGGVFHAAAFTALGLRVLRHGPASPRAPRRLLRPSLTAVGAAVVLSALFWATSVGHALRYQGARYAAVYAVLNVAALAGLVVAALRIRRSATEGRTVARSLLWLNAGLYLAFLLVLFPYLGEVP